MNVITLLIFTAVWFYKLHRIWFHVEEEYEKAVKRTKWIPAIFNQERFLVEDKQSWIVLMKVGSIPMTVLIVIINVLLLPSLLFGK